jgi:hypothetical protein
MLILISAFARLTQSTIDLARVFAGQWNVTEVLLDYNADEWPEQRFFFLEFPPETGSRMTFGDLIEYNPATGGLDPKKRIIINITRNRVGFDVSRFVHPDIELYPGVELTPIEFKFGADNMVTATGSHKGYIFSINVLSDSVIEITLFNVSLPSTTIYRCVKKATPHPRTWDILASFLPIVPMFLMMVFNGVREALAP